MPSSNLPKAYIIFNNSGEPEIVFDKHSDALEYIQHNTPAYTIKHCDKAYDKYIIDNNLENTKNGVLNE